MVARFKETENGTGCFSGEFLGRPVMAWGLGACPTLTFLLRRTIRNHLRRSRAEKILNVFHRIHLQFLQACGLAFGCTSFASSRRRWRTGSSVFGTVAVGASSARMVLVQPECKWVVRVLCRIVFFEMIALKM